MERVIGTKPVSLGYPGSHPDDRFADFEPKVSRPVGFQATHTPAVTGSGEYTFAVTAGERSPCFQIGDHRGRHQLGVMDRMHDPWATIFHDVEFHEGAGVEVESYRRPSSTA